MIGAQQYWGKEKNRSNQYANDCAIGAEIDEIYVPGENMSLFQH